MVTSALRALLGLGRLTRSVPTFELAGSVAIVVGVGLLAGAAWALIAGGVLLLLKSFDLALDDTEKRE